MVVMWAIALGIVVVQRDLGAALLFFAVFLALIYAATGRVSLVVIGLVLFLLGSVRDGQRRSRTSASGSPSGSTRGPTRSTAATRSSSRSTRSPAAA